MKWTKHRLKLDPVALSVPYRETTVAQLVQADLTVPPLLSPEVLTLLVRPDCKEISDFEGQYRRMLHCSTHPAAHYCHFILYPAERSIFSPKAELAQYQRWINRNLLSLLIPSDYAIAYRKGLSLADTMQVHAGKSCMIKMDISHFFDSIRAADVYRIFERFNYPKSVTTLLTKLCTLNGKLPQGVPSSPALANLVLQAADEDIGNYCHTHGITYTRYCDDLIFSADKADTGALIRFVTDRLAKDGFVVNRKKTRVMYSGTRHKALGVVCNDRAATDRRVRRQLRQEMHYIGKFGVCEHLLRKEDPQYLQAGQPMPLKYLRSLLGKVSWVLSFEPKNSEFLGYKTELCRLLGLYDELLDHTWFTDYDRLDTMAPETVHSLLHENGEYENETELFGQQSFW